MTILHCNFRWDYGSIVQPCKLGLFLFMIFISNWCIYPVIYYWIPNVLMPYVPNLQSNAHAIYGWKRKAYLLHYHITVFTVAPAFFPSQHIYQGLPILSCVLGPSPLPYNKGQASHDITMQHLIVRDRLFATKVSKNHINLLFVPLVDIINTSVIWNHKVIFFTFCCNCVSIYHVDLSWYCMWFY